MIDRPRNLLFRAWSEAGEALVTDSREMLDAAAARRLEGGRDPLEGVSPHLLCRPTPNPRQRAPIGIFWLVRGHGGDALVKGIYGHVGETRRCGEVVEYRIEQHEVKLGERFERLLGSGPDRHCV